MPKDRLLLLLFLLLHLSLSIATENNQCTSSCGDITNISFPFRLKGDPKICGDSKCGLSCINNRTILNLYSGEYYVRHIGYNNYTIRVADVGMRKGNCLSLPRRSLSSGNFSSDDPYSFGDYESYKFYDGEPSKTISIVNCTKAVDSRLYVDASSCIDGVEFSNLSSTSRRIYAMVDANVSNVETACTIELMAMIPWWVDGNHLLSYAQIHEQMVYGFELSWLPIAGKMHCKGHYYWFISSSKHRIRCGPPEGGLKDKLGEGGYGSVFKGRLRSDCEVAVKILKKGKANGQDFISEVSTIGRIHHVNVVGLIGFCFEGSKQALVYDFMHNGSLDKHIFSRGQGISLDCNEVYKIALGVARGIEYLHRGCDMQILHFDIKPHNILLDRDFNPKISDFGLAKLYPTNHNTVSMTGARGTLGYMAPELVYRNLGGVSYKADVYSFDKLLMEMASGRKNLDAEAENSS